MASALIIIKAFFTRLLFFTHGFVSIWLLVTYLKQSTYWALVAGLFCLFIEMCYTLGVRKGHEYKYFWPSGFFYIATLLPIIWTFEVRIFEENAGRDAQTKSRNSTLTSSLSIGGVSIGIADAGKKVSELGLIIGIIAGRWMMPRGKLTRDQLSALLLGYVGTAADIVELFETFDEREVESNKDVMVAVLTCYTWAILQFTLNTTATLRDNSSESDNNNNNNIDTERQRPYRKISRVGPNRKITPERKVSVNNRNVPERKTSVNNKAMSPAGQSAYWDPTTDKEQYISDLRRQRFSRGTEQPRGHGARKISGSSWSLISPSRSTEYFEARHKANMKSLDADADSRKRQLRSLHGELFQIMVTLLMQDGPFLVMRLYLMVKFGLSSEMHILFTCKNAMVCTLLVYRLCILTCKGEDKEDTLHKEEAANKLHNVQLAVLSAQILQSGRHSPRREKKTSLQHLKELQR